MTTALSPHRPSAAGPGPLRRRLRCLVGSGPHSRGGCAGQTTAEYALVILGAAGLATLLIAWATKSDAVGRLFDSVVEKILP